MIMIGKVIASLIWVFWMMAMSSAEGQVIGDNSTYEVLSSNFTEYTPTYSSTFDRVKKRGYVICGTNDDFQASHKNCGETKKVVSGKVLM